MTQLSTIMSVLPQTVPKDLRGGQIRITLIELLHTVSPKRMIRARKMFNFFLGISLTHFLLFSNMLNLLHIGS